MHVHFSICVYLQFTKYIYMAYALLIGINVFVFVFNMYLFIKHEVRVFICINN